MVSFGANYTVAAARLDFKTIFLTNLKGIFSFRNEGHTKSHAPFQKWVRLAGTLYIGTILGKIWASRDEQRMSKWKDECITHIVEKHL